MTAAAATELISQEKIQGRIDELAAQIAADYHGQPLTLIGVLTGGFIVLADLARALWRAGMRDLEIDFIKTTSYINDTPEGKTPPKVVLDLQKSIAGKHVLIVEDIADTGHTLYLAQKHLLATSPKSLKTLAFLDKPTKRQVTITLDYVGFVVDGWIEGYGLDSLRACPAVMVRK